MALSIETPTHCAAVADPTRLVFDVELMAVGEAEQPGPGETPRGYPSMPKYAPGKGSAVKAFGLKPLLGDRALRDRPLQDTFGKGESIQRHSGGDTVSKPNGGPSGTRRILSRNEG